MLGFDCDCSVDHDETPRVQNSDILTARKRYTCVECGRTIEPGESYEHYHGVTYDGRRFSHRTCLGCYRIRERFCPNGWYVGEVSALVAECLGFDYRDDPSEWDQEEVDEEDAENRDFELSRRQAAKGGGQ